MSVPTDVWNRVLALKLGQGLSDVTSATLAFGVHLANGNISGRDWRLSVISLKRVNSEAEELFRRFAERSSKSEELSRPKLV